MRTSSWDEERPARLGDPLLGEARARAGCPSIADFAAFWRDFEWMGVQRQLKVLGIFARLCHRDGKAGYLDGHAALDGATARPRAQRYRELAPLARAARRARGPRRGAG